MAVLLFRLFPSCPLAPASTRRSNVRAIVRRCAQAWRSAEQFLGDRRHVLALERRHPEFLLAGHALAVTGTLSAHLGHAPKARAVLRTVGGGVLATAITYWAGTLIGGR
jgi:hypothetical protein